MLAKEFSMDVLPHVIDMAMVQFLPFIRSYQGVEIFKIWISRRKKNGTEQSLVDFSTGELFFWEFFFRNKKNW